jgi:hypothetical protein
MAMKKLLAAFFGWQLVHLENSATEIVRVVRYLPDGEPYAVYFGSHLAFFTRPGNGWVATPLNFSLSEHAEQSVAALRAREAMKPDQFATPVDPTLPQPPIGAARRGGTS